MASLIKVIYVLVVLSIAADFINLRGYWLDTKRNSEEITVHSSSLFLPGANGWIGAAARGAAAVGRAISRSAKRAAKKKAKNQERVKGNNKNKAKKSQGGVGKYHDNCCF